MCQQAYLLIFLLQSFHCLPQLLDGHAGPILPLLRTTHSTLYNNRQQHSLQQQTTTLPTADNSTPYNNRQQHSLQQQTNTQTLHWANKWPTTDTLTDSPLAEDCPQHSTTTNTRHSNPMANKRLTIDTLDRFCPGWGLPTALYNKDQTTLKPYGQQATDSGHTGPILPLAEDCPQHSLQQQADNTQTLQPTSDWQWTHWTDSPLGRRLPTAHCTTTGRQHSNPTLSQQGTYARHTGYSLPWLKTTHSTIYNLDQTTLKVKLCCSGPIPAGSTMGLLLCRYPPVRGNQQTCSPPQMKPALLLQHTIRWHCLNGRMCLQGCTL